MMRRLLRRAPLPVRDGLNASRVRLPESGHWPTTLEYLRQRFFDDEDRLLAKVHAGEVVDATGEPITPLTPFSPDSFVFLYRDPKPEQRVPFEIEILYRDAELVVVDKPHFLATTPRGAYITECATVRLRRDLDLPDLSPLHRLDRVTAGVLVFGVVAAHRGAYQQLFARREVRKTYLAVAPAADPAGFPREVRSRIVKERGTPTAVELPGDPNAQTSIELITENGTDGAYRLRPTTGRTHQLRVHLNSIGLPIRNDAFYPRLLDPAPDDYSAPLQLLAHTISFRDPITGADRDFTSRRQLDLWPSTSDDEHRPQIRANPSAERAE